MCIGILLPCVSVCHMHVVPAQVRRGYQMPGNWNYRWFVGSCYMGPGNRTGSLRATAKSKKMIELL